MSGRTVFRLGSESSLLGKKFTDNSFFYLIIQRPNGGIEIAWALRPMDGLKGIKRWNVKWQKEGILMNLYFMLLTFIQMLKLIQLLTTIWINLKKHRRRQPRRRSNRHLK